MPKFRYKTDITEHCYMVLGDGTRIPLLDPDGLPTFEPQRSNKLLKLERRQAAAGRKNNQDAKPVTTPADPPETKGSENDGFII